MACIKPFRAVRPGRELAQQMRAPRPALHVIYSSGFNAGPGGLIHVLPPGDAVLPKPYAVPALLAALRQCLDQPAPAALRPRS